MKNKLYESLMTSISRVIKDTLNEESIWDMETANGKANSKSKAALEREKNIVYKLKELGIKAQYISAGSRQTSANGRNEENKLISGKNFSEYQTIHINNPINNELVAGDYYIYVKSAQSNYNNCVLSEKMDKFGKTIWENEDVKYIAFVFTQNRDFYEYFILDKKVLFDEFNKLIDKFKENGSTKRLLDKHTGNTIMYVKATGFNCTYCRDFIKKHCAMKFFERRYI